MNKIKAVFILGPTGVGKTELSVRLAKKFDGEIISSDSVQIYRGLDIGSAKVTKDEMKGVKHHAVDILEPEEEFSVFDYVELTKKLIADITARGKLPIVVGGTGLYVKALTLGYNFGGTEKNDELRSRLERLSREKGNDYLFELLKEKDSLVAAQTDKFNTVRLVRALEIALSDGKKKRCENNIDALVFGLNRDRERLYEAINKRVEVMIEKGLVGEVEALKKRGLGKDNQSMRAIGYKEVLDFLDGQYDYCRMVELIKQHSRNYAKRQLTFLRGMDNVHMVDVEDRNAAFETISNEISDWLG
jgi:tRNA dimethylallyltransferase